MSDKAWHESGMWVVENISSGLTGAMPDLTELEITDEDWEEAKLHFDTIWEAYRETAEVLGIISETVILDLAFGPLLARYQNGERTAALYEAMIEVE